ncbi:MAG: DUF262 domain-containing protein [Arcicella sp.]|jgi:uncharacterized protein with ParB-like and HNH nuclease domain|nr:DUF262 domain-containing protein [Arcicella sp.]
MEVKKTENFNKLSTQLHPRKRKLAPKTAYELEVAEREIKDKSIPYEYQTKQIPLKVIKLDFEEPENRGKSLIFIPDYQREFVWDETKQSKFIESLFLGVPIPPVFVAQTNEEGRLEVIDGSQRIRTVIRFLKNELKLRGLEKLKSLNGFYFNDFESPRQNKFNLIDMRFHVLTDKATAQTRADIFKRINTTSEPLTDSQIRKGEFANNAFYNFVLEMANSDRFKKDFYTGKDSKGNKGEHEELALRYFIYSESYLEHKHDVGSFLNGLIEKKEVFTDIEKMSKQDDFYKMLNFVERYFPHKFNKSQTGKAIPRVRFEAISVGVHLALKIKPDLVPTYMEWLDSDEFDSNTTSDASNNEGKLKIRVEFVRDCLLNIKTKEMLNFS